ncbi:hypothetical protein J6590_023911 [Homalodisca vitripennis]|nr:hypothetical protein J6590_023911 [Homalodisca vitripennis]
MGGVDMSDRMLSYCSSRQRTRKWTTRTIMHLFDLAISNSWLCYREDKIKSNIPLKKVAQLRKYKMDYGEYLIESNSILSDSEDSEYLTDEEVTPGRNPKELPSVRFRTHGNHLPEITPGVQQRCKNSKCSKKTSVKRELHNDFIKFPYQKRKEISLLRKIKNPINRQYGPYKIASLLTLQERTCRSQEAALDVYRSVQLPTVLFTLR